MIINTNLSALNAHSAIQSHSNVISDSMKKLASGLRINSASDDPGSIGLSEKMRSKIQSLNMAEQNCDYGISLLQITDMGLSEIQNILQKMNELSLQAQNDSLSDNDKNSLQVELEALSYEIDNIAKNTTFNNVDVLQVEYANDIYTGIVDSENVQMGDFLYTNDGFTISITGMEDGANINFVQKEVDTSTYNLTDPMDLSGSISATYDVVSGDITFEIYGGWEDSTGGTALVITDDMLQEALADALKEAKEGATNSQLVTINKIEMETTGTLNALAGTASGLDYEPVYKVESVGSSSNTTNGSSIGAFTIEGLDSSITDIVFKEVDSASGTGSAVVDENGVLTISLYNDSGTSKEISASMIQSYIQNATFEAGADVVDMSSVSFSFNNSSNKLILGDTTVNTPQTIVNAQNKESSSVSSSPITISNSGGSNGNLQMSNYTISNINGSENSITEVKFVEDTSNSEEGVSASVSADGVLTISISSGASYDQNGNYLAYFIDSSTIQDAIRNATVDESLADDLDFSNATFVTQNSSGVELPGVLAYGQSSVSGTNSTISTTVGSASASITGGTTDGSEVSGFSFSSIGEYDDLELSSLSDTVVGMGQVSTNVGLQVGYLGDDFDPKYIQIYDMRSKTLDVNNLDLTDFESAQDAQEKIETAINFVSSVRTKYGAIQNRLEYTTNYISSAVQFTEEAKSNLTDVDMAEELQNYSKTVMLKQAAQVMLAQSNVDQREAWTLLYDLTYYY